MLISRLTKLVAREGDLSAADAWLEKSLEHRSDDLDIDSAYRSALAFVALLKGDHQAVFAAIGRGLDDVPMASDFDLECVMIRAQTLEACGEIDAAVDQLVERFMRTKAGQAVVVSRAARDPLLPLTRSLPLAVQRLSAGADSTSVISNGRGLPALTVAIWISIVLAGAGVIAFAAPRLGQEAIGALVLLILFVVGKYILRFRDRLRGASQRLRGDLRTRGIAGRARIVSNRPLTGLVATRIEVELLVSIPGRPRYGARHREFVTPRQFARSDVGMNVKVLVDPDDPRRMAIDWT